MHITLVVSVLCSALWAILLQNMAIMGNVACVQYARSQKCMIFYLGEHNYFLSINQQFVVKPLLFFCVGVRIM